MTLRQRTDAKTRAAFGVVISFPWFPRGPIACCGLWHRLVPCLLDDGFSRCVSQVFVVAAAMSRPGSSCHPEDCQTHFSGLLPVATRMLPVFLPL
jgi:hypothetical protein